MKIPTKAMIAGIPIKTEYDEEFYKKHKAIGASDYAQQRIVLDPTISAKETLEQAYCHEAVHCIFHFIGRMDLRDDEDLVDMMGLFIHQIVTTAEFK